LAPSVEARSSCRWCDLHPDGTDALNGLDRSVRTGWVWQHPNTANTLSNVVAYGVVPAVALGADAWAAHAGGHGDNFKVDALVIGESVLAAAGAAEILKYATARLRPYAHARALGQPTDVAPSSSDNLSFSSGHAVFAFAMTVSTARVMTLRRYGHAGWVWGLGLPAAAAVGYLRIAADRHYLTDVLASAGIGTAMGLIVPRLAFATPPAGSGSSRSVAIMPGFGGPLVVISCTW
jgi:membrane-associated phospholipid phosphatase